MAFAGASARAPLGLCQCPNGAGWPGSLSLKSAFEIRTTGLLAGEEAIPLQRTNPELKFFKYQSLNWGMFYMRTDQPPFNDVRVRRALSLAINRPAWLETLEFGEGCLITGPIPCALPGWKLDVKELDPAKAKYLAGFDREEARRLLAEAGYPKGFTTPMHHHPGYTTP